MPSSVDMSRLQGLQAGIAEGNRGAAAVTSGIQGLGDSAFYGTSKALKNRADLAKSEGEEKRLLQKDLIEWKGVKRGKIALGQDTYVADENIKRIEKRLRELGEVDLGAPTPSWGIDRKAAQPAFGAKKETPNDPLDI